MSTFGPLVTRAVARVLHRGGGKRGGISWFATYFGSGDTQLTFDFKKTFEIILIFQKFKRILKNFLENFEKYLKRFRNY